MPAFDPTLSREVSDECKDLAHEGIGCTGIRSGAPSRWLRHAHEQRRAAGQCYASTLSAGTGAISSVSAGNVPARTVAVAVRRCHRATDRARCCAVHHRAVQDTAAHDTAAHDTAVHVPG